MRQNPDHRAEALSAGATPAGTLEEEFSKFLAGGSVSDDLAYAADIYEDAYKSEVIESFILARADSVAIQTIVRVPATVVETYKYLFFDLNVFRDELDIESYAQTYPENTPELKWGKDLKICAITLGLDYLNYRFSRNANSVDMTKAMQTMVETAFMLAKSTKLNPMDSNAAREARQWMAQAQKGIETYARIKPVMENTDNEFELVLETIERTTNAAKSGIKPEDITH